jgi:hypothetical protein
MKKMRVVRNWNILLPVEKVQYPIINRLCFKNNVQQIQEENFVKDELHPLRKKTSG